MPKRIVDDLEAVEIKEQNGEFHFRFVGAGVGTGASAHLIERQPKQSPVRKAGQRIFGGKPGNMGFRLAPLGDVGEGLHEAAVGKVSAANFDDGAVWHGSFGDRELARRFRLSSRLRRGIA